MSADLVLVANAGDSTVTTYELTTEGTPHSHPHPRLRHLATSPVGKGCSTFVIDEATNLVYAGAKAGATGAFPAGRAGMDEPGIDTFSLDHRSGALIPVPGVERRTTEGSVAYLCLTPERTILAGALYHQGSAHTWSLDGTGAVGPSIGRVEWSHAHCVAVTDHHLYVVSLGEDCVAQYALAATGHLTALDPPTAPAPEGSGPRHLVLDHDASHAYVVTEFSGEVLTFDRDHTTGLLTAEGERTAYATDRGLAHSRLGADPRADHLIWGADVHLARDDSILLASERTESTLSAHPVTRAGVVGPAASLLHTPTQPRGFAVSTNGRYAVVAGERASHLTLVAVGEDGSLRTVQEIATGAGSNWVRTLPRA